MSVDYPLYANLFPATADSDCAVVKLTGGGSVNERANIAKPTFQILLRGQDSAAADAKAWDFYRFLNNKRDFNVDDTHVIFCTAQQAAPLFLGSDDNERVLYSLNFQLITEQL
nr:minor capsid protein [Heliobacterium chlorum]